MTSTDLPLVSVICLCYNHSKYVIESINPMEFVSLSDVKELLNEKLKKKKSLFVFA